MKKSAKKRAKIDANKRSSKNSPKEMKSTKDDDHESEAENSTTEEQDLKNRKKPSRKSSKLSTPSLSSSTIFSKKDNRLPLAIHEGFVMKLFDRSLDLSLYEENAPLYPICRAWMINNPRLVSINRLKDKKASSPPPRDKDNEVLEKLKEGTITQIVSLPAPKPLSIPRQPSPISEQKMFDKTITDDEIDKQSKSIDEIMEEHKKRWIKVRNKCYAHSKACDQRYIESFEIFEAIHKPPSN